MFLCIAGILCEMGLRCMGPKIYEAQDTNGFSNGLLFVRFPERDIVGHLFTFYCYLFAKWKSFLGSTNLQNGKASRPLKGSSHESLCTPYHN
jgi:hypothetical protein